MGRARVVRKRSRRGGVTVAMGRVPDEIAAAMGRKGPDAIRADWRLLMQARVDKIRGSWPVDTGKSARSLKVFTAYRNGKIKTTIRPSRAKYARHITPAGQPRKGSQTFWAELLLLPLQVPRAHKEARDRGSRALFKVAELKGGG